MNTNQEALKLLKLYWSNYEHSCFSKTNVGNSGCDVFIGRDAVFKFCPQGINYWQKLSFQNELIILSQLSGKIGEINIPEIIKSESTISCKEAYLQTKIEGQSLSEIIKNNPNLAESIFANDNFINSIASFLVDFNQELTSKKIDPLKTHTLTMMSDDNLDLLKEKAPITYLLFDYIKKQYEKSNNKFCWTHNDLNFENIFIDNNNKISIIDFGEATRINPLLAIGKIFYSLNLNGEFELPWKISQRAHELSPKLFPSPKEVIAFSILPHINKLHFKLLSAKNNIDSLFHDIELISKKLFLQSNIDWKLDQEQILDKIKKIKSFVAKTCNKGLKNN